MYINVCVITCEDTHHHTHNVTPSFKDTERPFLFSFLFFLFFPL